MIYRQLLLTLAKPEGISAVILFHETVFQKADDGKLLIDHIKANGLVPGIKVDKGVKVLFGAEDNESTTQGLDDLDVRCKEYKALGLQFAKWRYVTAIATCRPNHKVF